ncbi:MAG: hypothetical protein V3S48_00535, partial [Candidatus Neomarinimicrobiota bacterium]
MKKPYSLKDNRSVTVRDLTTKDVDMSLNFFNSLPEIERRYLRSKVTDRNHIEARIQSSLSGQIIRRI